MPGLTACLFYGDRTSEATTIPPLCGGTPNVIRLIARGGTPNVTRLIIRGGTILQLVAGSPTLSQIFC